MYELRYCPRCDRETIWASLTGGTVFVCAFQDDENASPGCGLSPLDELSDDECERARLYGDAPLDRFDPRRLQADRPIPRYHRV